MRVHEKEPSAPERDGRQQTSCPHCGGELELLNIIPRLGARPRYRIFSCVSCKKIEWIEG